MTNLSETLRSSDAPSGRDTDVHDTPEWHLVQRIADSPGFHKSPLLKSFLLYITEQKLRGHSDGISEFQIGVRALRRPSAYNPGDDNIVRNYARKLRLRLDEYFLQNPGESLRISVPLGSYIPEFEEIKAAELQPPVQRPDPVPATDHAHGSFVVPVGRTLIAVLILLLVIGACGFMHKWYKSRPAALFHQFWGEVFDPTRATYVVTSDSGIAMLQDLSGHYIHLQQYVSNSLQQELSELDLVGNPQRGRFGVNRFSGITSTATLDIAVRMAAMSEYRSGQAVVRSARDIRMDDLNRANAIFLGGPHANPWIELFDSTMDFRIEFPQTDGVKRIGEKWIVDAHPEPGARKTYTDQWSGNLHETYAILAFLPSLDRNGYVLLSEGQNMGGTAAAIEFAMNATAMAPVLRKARLSDGTIGPFQLLLKTAEVGVRAPEAHIVIERYGLRK